jgi:hypothetical protein
MLSSDSPLWVIVGFTVARAATLGVTVLFALGRAQEFWMPSHFLATTLMVVAALQPPGLEKDAKRPSLFVRAAALPVALSVAAVLGVIGVLTPGALRSFLGLLLPASLTAYVAAAWVQWLAVRTGSSRGPAGA